MSVELYYTSENYLSSKLAETNRPLIIGQDDAVLENAFNHMHLTTPTGEHNRDVSVSPQAHEVYAPDMIQTPLWGPYFTPQMSASRSFATHRDLNGQHVPSPLNLQKTTFNGPDSGEVSQWSPFYSPYSDYGMQSAAWSPYTPGAIGQERGTVIMPSYRSGY